MKHTRILSAILALLLLLPAMLGGCKKGIQADTAGQAEKKDKQEDTILTHLYGGELYSAPDGMTMFTTVTPHLTEDGGLVCCAERGGKPSVCTLDADSSLLSEMPLSLPVGAYLSRGAITANALTALVQTDNGLRMMHFDLQNGETTADEDAESVFTSKPHVRFLVCAPSGKVLLATEDEVVILNEDLTFSFSISGKDGVLSAACDEKGDFVLQLLVSPRQTTNRIDTEQHALGEALSVPWEANAVFGGAGHDLYFAADDGIYSFDGGITELLMSFENSSVDRNTVLVWAANEETFLLQFSGSESGFALYRRLPDYNLADTKVLLLAHTVELEFNIPDQITKFNRKHREVRIAVDDYTKYNTTENPDGGARKLATDIITGTCRPDIVIGKPGNADIDQIVRRHLYADLAPFLEADPKVNFDNLFGGVRRAFTAKDGSLWGLTTLYTLKTLLSTREILGPYADHNSWTIRDLLDFRESLPEGHALMSYLTQETIVDRLFGPQGFRVFIDEEAAVCSFDSEAFRRFLQACLDYPASYPARAGQGDVYPYSGEEFYLNYQTGVITLYEKEIVSYFALLTLGAAFGTDDYVMIGYPTEGESGTVLTPNNAIVITSSCADPDSAWEFLRSLWTGGFHPWDSGILPVFRHSFDEGFQTYLGYQCISPYRNMGNSHGISQEIEEPNEPSLVLTLTEEYGARIRDYLDNDVGFPLTESLPDEILDIIREEMSALYAGAASVDSCAKRIQSRVSIWLAEHK